VAGNSQAITACTVAPVSLACLTAQASAAWVDVGLKEPVEKHQAVRAGLVQPLRDLAGRTELRAELDRHRHGHRVFDPAQDVHVPLPDLTSMIFNNAVER
jgi:hypothetical protein